MLRRKVLFELILLITFFSAFITLAASKCDGVCVKFNECHMDFGGVKLFHVRFGEEDYEEAECPHYLDVCCDADGVVTTNNTVNNSVESDVGKDNANASSSNAEAEPSTSEGTGTRIIGDEDANDNSRITQFDECGMRNPDGLKFKIENANDNQAQFSEFPWMVAILQNKINLDQSELSYACGGSLISPNVVLTAAHCVMDKEPRILTVRAGEWDTMTEKETLPYHEQPVHKIVFHPHFNRDTLFHDIALLVLEKPFSAADNVQLACLAPQGMVFEDTECFATGWGKTAFDAQNYNAILKKVPLPIIPKNECQTALRTTRLGPRFFLHKSFICAGGSEGVDTCTGDGGSPLVCPVAGSVNKYHQAGIVSWGINCGQQGIPGVYVQASLYTNWIYEELGKNGFIGADEQNNQQASINQRSGRTTE